MPSFNHQRSFHSPHHDHGFWSPSTSSANFCEEDYIVTYHIAEFINTISNLAYIHYAFYPPQNLPRSLLGRKNEARRQTWDLSSIALIFIGLTSGVFHATLQQFPQWLDESSMYLLAAAWIHALLTTSLVEDRNTPGGNKPGNIRGCRVVHRNQTLTWAVLVLCLAFASMVTAYTGVLAVHSVMFAALLVLSGIKLIYLIHRRTATTGGLRSNPVRRAMLISLIRSTGFLLLGFGLWLVDTNPEICAWLRYVRSDLLGVWYLVPLGWLTELHGWWHVLTARAAGEYMVLVRILTSDRSLHIKQ